MPVLPVSVADARLLMLGIDKLHVLSANVGIEVYPVRSLVQIKNEAPVCKPSLAQVFRFSGSLVPYNISGLQPRHNLT